ncbi:LCP family protein [Companilactobacillus kimchiensis]|nr:LCP family protein [Companilactobacillus kimchiensis]
MHNNKAKKHTFRNLSMWFVLLFVLGGATFGMTRYRSVKSSANSSYVPSGVTSKRNVSSLLNNSKPVSILLMGVATDQTISNYNGDTNSMMVLTLNPKTNKTTITSISDDLAIKGSAKTIGAAYANGQTKAAVTAVENTLNVPVDFYALINMGGMNKAINDANGVTVTPNATFTSNGYSFTNGVSTHMNGDKATAYLAMKNGDDAARQQRQRDVLSALVSKSASISTLFNQDLIDSVSDQVQTDMTFDNMTALAKNYNSVGKNTTNNSIANSSDVKAATSAINSNLGL